VSRRERVRFRIPISAARSSTGSRGRCARVEARRRVARTRQRGGRIRCPRNRDAGRQAPLAPRRSRRATGKRRLPALPDRPRAGAGMVADAGLRRKASAAACRSPASKLYRPRARAAAVAIYKPWGSSNLFPLSHLPARGGRGPLSNAGLEPGATVFFEAHEVLGGNKTIRVNGTGRWPQR